MPHPDAVRSCFASFFLIAILFTGAGPTFADDPDAVETMDRYEIARPEGAGSAELRLVDPDGELLRLEFDVDQTVQLEAVDIQRLSLNSGLYLWEVRFAPIADAGLVGLLDAARRDGADATAIVEAFPARSGSFRVVDGRFQIGMVVEPRDADGGIPTRDQVIADDLIVQQSLCVGMDCVNNENFGFDTIRLKENNLRIAFDDTSVGTFPANDWELTANDSASGGVNRFSILDRTAGRDIFTVRAGAPANSIYVDTAGRVGFGTSTPALELHVVNGDSPALRLDQSTSSGFAAQAWDIAGNETNFFVRDLTNGSSLPFRIEPGAATSSIHIGDDENIGFGLATPAAVLHGRRNAGFVGEWLRLELVDDGNPATEERRMVLDGSGNLFVGGAISQLSSRDSKGNLIAVAGDQLLSKLSTLPIWTWNYLRSTDADRHIGPVAEDFYRSFGFGTSERSLSPSDVAGVALAASQALTREIEQRDQRIEQLEARLARLEAVLLEQENAADTER